MKQIYLFLTGILFSAMSFGQVIISEVYGGGGNTGAIYTNDYVVLYNKSAASVDITGWSLHYASATGTSWTNSVVFPATTILTPGQYYVIQCAAGTVGDGVPLPSTNYVVTPSTTFNMSATKGKLVLLNDATAPTSGTSCPSANVVDKVSWGTGDCPETASAPSGSNTTSIKRKVSGTQDTDDNSIDFEVLAPVLGVDDVNASFKNQVKFSSTIVKDNVRIFNEGKTNVELYNLNGQLLKTVNGSDEVTLDTAALAKGVYLVKVSQDSKSITQKIIKQ